MSQQRSAGCQLWFLTEQVANVSKEKVSRSCSKLSEFWIFLEALRGCWVKWLQL